MILGRRVDGHVQRRRRGLVDALVGLDTCQLKYVSKRAARNASSRLIMTSLALGSASIFASGGRDAAGTVGSSTLSRGYAAPHTWAHVCDRGIPRRQVLVVVAAASWFWWAGASTCRDAPSRVGGATADAQNPGQSGAAVLHHRLLLVLSAIRQGGATAGPYTIARSGRGVRPMSPSKWVCASARPFSVLILLAALRAGVHSSASVLRQRLTLRQGTATPRPGRVSRSFCDAVSPR
jgi:hypothetical protein